MQNQRGCRESGKTLLFLPQRNEPISITRTISAGRENGLGKLCATWARQGSCDCQVWMWRLFCLVMCHARTHRTSTACSFAWRRALPTLEFLTAGACQGPFTHPRAEDAPKALRDQDRVKTPGIKHGLLYGCTRPLTKRDACRLLRFCFLSLFIHVVSSSAEPVRNWTLLDSLSSLVKTHRSCRFAGS